MKYLTVLFLVFVLCGAAVVEKDPTTGEILCSYDTENSEGQVQIDKTRDIYIDDELWREADVVEVKAKSIAEVQAELVAAK